MMIPLFSPVRQNEPLTPEILAKFSEILKSGEYILGKDLQTFEENLAAKTGYRHAVGCSSGTDALILALKAVGIQHGDEVVTPAFSFVASANAIAWAGAKPIFADVDLETACVTVETVERAITSRTKAVIAVDLFGRQAPITELKKLCEKHSLFLIEDGAQSIGVPNRGPHAYTTSFYPTKNLGAIGDAGAVMTDDPEIASRIKEISRHGGLLRDHYLRVGTNGRLDTLQAAILNIKLPHLEGWTKVRRSLAGWYLTHLKPLENAGKLWLPPEPQDLTEHVWALFTLRLGKQRDAIAQALKNKGVGCGVYYPRAIPEQPSFQNLKPNACPNAERLAAEVLSIPLFPELTGKEFDAVVKALQECLLKNSI